MSSVITAKIATDDTGEQVLLERQDWFSDECIRLLEEACDNPAIGPERVLVMILHHSLGVPLSLCARLTGRTKNVVAKQVITSKKRLLVETAEYSPA